ncbi:MAG: thioredoxin domain-containing protein [Candidatus Paceibacterota bacterium]
MQKLGIPIAIVIAGVIIAGAIVWGGDLSLSGERSANSTTGQNLNYDPAEMQTVIDEVGVEGKILGDPNAPIIITEYSDTECPFCQRFHNTMMEVINKYGASGEVAWEYKHFPIPQLHRKAAAESHALECIYELGGDEAFWIAIDTIYTITPSNDGLNHALLPEIAEIAGVDAGEFNECQESGDHQQLVEAEAREAQENGGRGTPYSVIHLNSALSAEGRAAVEEVDAQASQDRELFKIVEDGTQIQMSGAMPFNLIDQLVTAILESNA